MISKSENLKKCTSKKNCHILQFPWTQSVSDVSKWRLCPYEANLANRWTEMHYLLLINVASERHFIENILLIGHTEARDFLMSIVSTCACWLQTAGTGEFNDFSSPSKTRKDDLVGFCKGLCLKHCELFPSWQTSTVKLSRKSRNRCHWLQHWLSFWQLRV